MSAGEIVALAVAWTAAACFVGAYFRAGMGGDDER